MVGGMPYWLEKGPALSILEDFLDHPVRLKAYLLHLLTGGDIVTAGGYDDRYFEAIKAYLPKHDIVRHVEEDWFAAHGSFWHGYEGANVGSIVRHAMIRAAAVSLGIPKIDLGGQDALPLADAKVVVDQANRHWPIALFWKCGQSWFETWVTWSGKRTIGSVNVMFATPPDRYVPTVMPGYMGVETHAIPAPVVPSPNLSARDTWLDKGRSDGFAAEVIRGSPSTVVGGRPVPPLDLTVDKGMCVVTHESNELVSYLPQLGFRDPSAVDPPPGARYTGTGRIVLVSPAETWGGVLAPAGRRFQGP